MAIFGQIQRNELGTKYTHYGWFGICPVYLGDISGEAPVMAERNWVPGWWLSVSEWIFGKCILLRSIVDADYEPMWPIAIGGEIRCSVQP